MLNFIVNATSGKGRGQKTLKKIIAFCYKNKIEYTVHITSCKGHATKIAKALCDNNSHTIIAVGGDGTFHEVLNGITTLENTHLGFIAAGRGNDFAKGMGIPLSPIKALKKIVQGKTRQIDFLEISGKRCLNVAGTGLDVDVLKRVDGKRGKITYIKSLLYCLFNFVPYNISLKKDGATNNYSCIMVGACNSKQFGGGIKISPLSRADDGLMNIVVMSLPKSGRIMSVLPKFLKGKHIGMDITEHFLCDQISIKMDKPYPIQLDGEIYEDLAFECKVIKGGLKTFEY